MSSLKLTNKELELKKLITEDEKIRWREYYTPNPKHEYYQIRTIDHLHSSPLNLEISASRYEEKGDNKSALNFRKQAVFCKLLLQEFKEKENVKSI